MDNNEINKTDNDKTSEVKDDKPEVVKVNEVNKIKIETFRFNSADDKQDSTDKKNEKSSASSKASDNNKQAVKNNILKFKRKISFKPKKQVLAVGIIIIAAIVLAVINKNRIVEISDKNVISDEVYEVNSRASFYINGQTTFYATKDGMIIRNSKTKSEITDTYTMKSPLLKYDGSYVAVAERKGKQVRLYNDEGNSYNIVCDGEIVTFAINSLGYGAVCYTNANDNSYTVDLYNNMGNQLSHTKSTMSNGIPVTIDISDNGGIFAIGFVNTLELNLKSNIIFYYPNVSDASTVDNSDGMFSSFIFNDQILSEIHFLNNNDCIAVTDSGMFCYKYGNSSYSEKWSKIFGNYITAIDYPGENSVICGFGTKNNIETDNKYDSNTAVWYNDNGNEIMRKSFNKQITDLYSQSNAVIIGMSKYFESYDMRGNMLWTYSSTQDVKSMQFYKNTDSVMIVTPTKMSVINIKNGTKITDDKEALTDELSESETEAQQPETNQSQSSTGE